MDKLLYPLCNLETLLQVLPDLCSPKTDPLVLAQVALRFVVRFLGVASAFTARLCAGKQRLWRACDW